MNNKDFILHPNKDLITNNFFNEKNKNIEPFFEGPQGFSGEVGMRGLRGDRGIRGSEGPAGPAGPAGEGLGEADLMARSLWCVSDNQCQTPKNIVARFRDDTIIKVGPNTAGNKSLVLGGRNNETGEAGIYTSFNDVYVDAANADEKSTEPGNVYISKNSKGNTYINEEGESTLLNDRSGFVGVNMQGTLPENNMHIKGDRPLTVENVDENAGTAGILFKDKRSEKNFSIGSTNIGFYLKDDNTEKYSFVAKDGVLGVGTQVPDNNFSLDVDKVARFRNDLRLSGGSDASIQLNMSEYIGDRKDFKNTDISRGLELMGGDIGASKVRFFGDSLEVNYGRELQDKILLRFTKNGVEFEGPTNFKDYVTFSGPKDIDSDEIDPNNPTKSAMIVKNKALFEDDVVNLRSSYWGKREESEEWTQINNKLFETNNGVRLFSKSGDTNSFGDIIYDSEKTLSDADQTTGFNITKGAFVLQDNLVVEGKGGEGFKGIQTQGLKSATLQADQIRTNNAITFSDKRLKENIKLINPQDNINKLMKINGYEYTNKITNKNDKGVIAQQIEKANPELVDSNHKFKGVKYDNIIPMLIEGIKHQQKEIDLLKSKIK